MQKAWKQQQAGDIDALTNSLNEAVTSIKSVFDAIAEEDIEQEKIVKRKR